MAGRDYKLIEIGVDVDGHESGECGGFFRDDDRRVRHQFVAPAFAPPRHARGKIDGGVSLLPGLTPQRDGGVFVLWAIGAEGEGIGHWSPRVMPGLDPGIHPLRMTLT